MTPCIVIRLINFNLHTHFDFTVFFFIGVRIQSGIYEVGAKGEKVHGRGLND